MKFKKDRIQLLNPKLKKWVKVDTKNAKILGYKIIPWKNIRLRPGAFPMFDVKGSLMFYPKDNRL